MKTLGIISLGVILSLWITAGWAQDHPHDWIKRFNVPGTMTDCCAGKDCVQLPSGTLRGLGIGDAVHLPTVGSWAARDVPIQMIYPAPPSGGEWGCHTGCFFKGEARGL